MWGSVDSDQMFSPFSIGGLLIRYYDSYNGMNEQLGLEMNLLSPQGPFWGIWRWAHFPGSLGEE